MYTIVLLSLASSALCLDPEVQEKYEKLPRDDFVKYFNSKSFSWKIKNNAFVDEKMMNSVEMDPVVIDIKPKAAIKGYAPIEFDASQYWAECVLMTYSRVAQNCSSSWAISAAGVASDRICTKMVRPSPDVFPMLAVSLADNDLTCCKDCFSKNFCSGGSPEKALLFYIKNGLVTHSCKYKLSPDEECEQACIDDVLYYMADKHFGEKMYILPQNDHEIRGELFGRGPLLATFVVYEDFKDYSSGIYEHTHGKLVGHHSVKVLGYGVEEGVPYWLAVNSWGSEWGQSGMFKIKRFQSDIGFEKRMISVYPRIFN